MPGPGQRGARASSAGELVAFRVTLPSNDEDLASGLLWDLGPRGIEVRAAAASGSLELIAYFERRPGLRQRIATTLRCLPRTRVEPLTVPQVDWVAHVRASFQPLAIGSFQVVPAWREPPPTPDPRTLIVDPGRAFGTGDHETTRLCLAALEARAARGALGRVLDLGAGTGILAIAALRLGAERACAIDLDPDAVASVAHHARLNGVNPSLLRGDGAGPFRPACFDTVMANLTAPLLSSRSAEILALLRPRGALILSGFLVEDVCRVREAYLPAEPLRLLTQGEWAALCA